MNEVIFKRNAVIALKKNVSEHFTAFLTKINREVHRISYKYSPHQLSCQNNVRNAVHAINAVEKLIHRNSPHSIQNSSHLFSND